MAIVIHCPNLECRKPLITRAVLSIGCQFNCRCGWCAAEVRVEVSARHGVMRKVVSRDVLPDDDDSGIVFAGGD